MWCSFYHSFMNERRICIFLSNHHSLIVTSAHHYTSYWSSHSLAPGSRGRTELNTQCYAKTYPWLSYFSTNLNFSVYIKGLERIQYHKPNDYSRQRSRSNAGTSISSVRLPHQCRWKWYSTAQDTSEVEKRLYSWRFNCGREAAISDGYNWALEVIRPVRNFAKRKCSRPGRYLRRPILWI